MVKAKVLNDFWDEESQVMRYEGKEYDFSKERYIELLKKEYLSKSTKTDDKGNKGSKSTKTDDLKPENPETDVTNNE